MLVIAYVLSSVINKAYLDLIYSISVTDPTRILCIISLRISTLVASPLRIYFTYLVSIYIL